MLPDMRPISASQIKAKRKCYRRYAFRYLERLPDPAGPAAQHGSEMHRQLEHWLLYGKMPIHVDALAAMREAPRPLSALAETKVTWQHDGEMWGYQAIIDVAAGLLSKARFETSPFFEPGQPVLVLDYKFTSNLKYALAEHGGLLVDPNTLEPDPQSTMYADHYFQRGFDDVHGKWIYTETKHAAGKRPRVRPVWVHFSRDAVAEAMCGVRADAADLYQLYRIRPKANDVPFDKAACYAFGQPCPYLSRCSRPESESMFSSLDTDHEGEDMTSFASHLASTFPLDEEELPPVPEEDLPDVPEEDDAPALPDEDESDGMSEEERRELVAAELARQRTLAGTVEKGFVNAPGEPETVTRNPEEHAERYADPVAPSEIKAPSFRFVKKHRPALLAKCVELGLAPADTSVTATGLAKLLRGAKVDPEALVGVEIVSQGPVDEEELPPLVPESDVPQDAVDALPQAVSDVSEIRVERLDARALRELHESAVTADAQDVPGAAEVVEKCEAEMERRGGFEQKIADAVKVPFPSDVSEQDKAARRLPGVRIHVPGAVESIDVGPGKMSVGGVEIRVPEALIEEAERDGGHAVGEDNELDDLTAALPKLGEDGPSSCYPSLEHTFRVLGDLAKKAGARIVITFGE